VGLRAKLLWMLLGQALLLLFVWANLTLWAGELIDATCTEGRLSSHQAECINVREWDKCPKYRHAQSGLVRNDVCGHGPSGACQAEVGYRVIVRECSEFMRKWSLRDNETWEPIRKRLQIFFFGKKI